MNILVKYCDCAKYAKKETAICVDRWICNI